jgi:hypothetical protein
VAKKSKRHNKSLHRTKKGTDEKKRLVGRRLTAAQKKHTFARRVPRKEEEEDTRERVLSLLRAVLRIKEIE